MRIALFLIASLTPSAAMAQSIDFWSAGFTADGSELDLYYTTDVVGCLDLTLATSTSSAPLQLTPVLCNGPGTWLIDEPVADFLAVAGDDVRLCDATDYTICSSATAVVSIELERVAIQGPNVLVTYTKLSEYLSDYGYVTRTCAHIVDGGNPWLYGGLHTTNWFCDDGEVIDDPSDLSDFDAPFAEGMLVTLCHGNNYNVCGLPTTVTRLPGVEVTGACGGAIDLHFTGMTAGSRYAIFSAFAEGSDVIASGPCAGIASGLASPNHRMTKTANASGEGGHALPAPGPCGAYMQALDVATCTMTNVASF